MKMVPNTDIEILDELETAFEAAKANYAQFEIWYNSMAGTRGGILPKFEMDRTHQARCVLYLRNRLTVECALPGFRKCVSDLEDLTKKVSEEIEEHECQSSQLVKVNYLIALAFIHTAKELIDKADDHIERSESVNHLISGALADYIANADDPEVLTKIAKHFANTK